MDASTLYVVDTSSLIFLQRWRPINRHPTTWQHIDQLIQNERLISPHEVYDEVRTGIDSLAEWAKRCVRTKRFFRKTSRQVVGIARQLISHFPEFIDIDRPVSQADPFVVALAISESTKDLIAPKCVVVTEEKFAPTGRPKIPNVCGARKISYMSIHQLFVAEGWTF